MLAVDIQPKYNFTNFSTEVCCDIVKVYDAAHATNLIGSFSGHSLPPKVISTGRYMFVTFTSDVQIVRGRSGEEIEGYELTLSRGEEQAYNMIKTEHDSPVYDLINTNHDKTDKRVNISWRQWLVFVLLTITISLVTSGLAVAVTYLSVCAELEVRINKNYALLMTKQNISATDIPALVNTTRVVLVPNGVDGNKVCKIEHESGRCRARSERYYYNWKTAQCEQFIYGGCGGNGNNFQSISDCQAACP
ncbi:unnamed protein product [Mytilus coruscus]|uniref:BPTI/Kunitz inhibitor domain-containing protein n=1 Tax=Mytilus coruscus TaxID=42192 RepID=A0A6J8EXN9_MYTCO|nr:unnamed protein product [Mytilus coruscus]